MWHPFVYRRRFSGPPRTRDLPIFWIALLSGLSCDKQPRVCSSIKNIGCTLLQMGLQLKQWVNLHLNITCSEKIFLKGQFSLQDPFLNWEGKPLSMPHPFGLTNLHIWSTSLHLSALLQVVRDAFLSVSGSEALCLSGNHGVHSCMSTGRCSSRP